MSCAGIDCILSMLLLLALSNINGHARDTFKNSTSCPSPLPHSSLKVYACCHLIKKYACLHLTADAVATHPTLFNNVIYSSKASACVTQLQLFKPFTLLNSFFDNPPSTLCPLCHISIIDRHVVAPHRRFCGAGTSGDIRAVRGLVA